MNKAGGTLAALAAGASGLVVRRVGAARHRAAPDGAVARRWHVVTINKPPAEVAPGGRVPGPVAELGDIVETQVRAAPGNRGTELAARLREAPSSSTIRNGVARLRGENPRQRVRSALRRTKQLLEVGEVLALDPQPAGRRSRTPAGAVLDTITRRAGGEGVA
jgi:uncharacterized membrane protein